MSGKVVKPCEACGKEMRLKPSHSHQKFCSISCRSAGHSELRTCPACKKEFRAELNRIRENRDRYCGRSCRFSATMEERFWSKVDKHGPAQDHASGIGNCWIWLGSKDGLGYGFFRRNTKVNMSRAHRVSWEISNGTQAPLLVLHKCDNPSCVRPDHLFLGTDQDNCDDKMNKGRHGCPRGEASYKAKLTVDKVREIRSSAASTSELCLRYGVKPNTILRVRNREAWKHVA